MSWAQWCKLFSTTDLFPRISQRWKDAGVSGRSGNTPVLACLLQTAEISLTVPSPASLWLASTARRKAGRLCFLQFPWIPQQSFKRSGVGFFFLGTFLGNSWKLVFVWLLACRSHGIGLIPSNVAQIPSSLRGGLGMGQTTWTSGSQSPWIWDLNLLGKKRASNWIPSKLAGQVEWGGKYLG